MDRGQLKVERNVNKMGNVFDIFLLQITVSTEHGRSNSTIGKRVGGRRSVQRRSICSSITVLTNKTKKYQQTRDELCDV